MELNRGGSPRRRRSPLWAALVALIVLGALGLTAGLIFYRSHVFSPRRMNWLMSFLTDPASRPEWRINALETCQGAPFQMPTDGYIGFLWGDSFRVGHHHQGIDIFGGQDIGLTPVYTAYPGYLTRLPDWKSTLIVRIPNDPLQPGRQIWTYYTHMAAADGSSFIVDAFPPGTSEVPVEAGTLIGYQGNFSGSPDNPTGIHLHFSIVLDDGEGSFRNELDIDNTIDPSPYLGLPLNAWDNRDTVPLCATP